MVNKTKIKKLLPKLHLCCGNEGLRPILSHILVTKENIVATNAHVLIVYKTESIFGKDFIEAMPERFLIHRKLWALMAKNHVHIFFKEGLINVRYDDYTLTIKPLEESIIGVYPKWEWVINTSENLIPVDKIGLNPAFLNLLSRAMFKPFGMSNFRLEFYGDTKGIMVYPLDSDVNAFGLIMPVALNF